MATKPSPENQNQGTQGSGDDSAVEKTLLKNHFVRALAQLERLHRCLLELIKLELERRASEQQVTSAQALFLYNIGDGKLSATELRVRGYYTGSNLSYTIAKLVVLLSLTETVHEIKSMVAAVYEGHVPALQDNAITEEDLERLVAALKRLEQYWAEHIRYGL
jgi:hypothetical protein